MINENLTIQNPTKELKESGMTLTNAIAQHYKQASDIDSGKALSIAKSVVATITNNSYLCDCAKKNTGSIIDCINQAISLGLTIDANQYCWLIPYNTKVDGVWTKKIQLQVGFKGYIYKINKSFPNTKIQACLVKEKDVVEIKKVENNDIVNHTYSDPFSKESKNIIGAYCIITFADGKSIVETINRADIDLIKSKSKTKEDGVWEEWEGEMVKKSVIKRACKVHFPAEVSSLEEYDNKQYDIIPKTKSLEDMNK